MCQIQQVSFAEAFRGTHVLGSRGNAMHMLLRQFNFPFRYRKDEILFERCADLAERDDPIKVRSCLRRYACGIESFNSTSVESFASWVLREENDVLLRFLVEVMAADQAVAWNGFRIKVSVADNGHTVYELQIFARNPASNTPVYTGEKTPNGKHAPNVLPGRYWD